MAYRGADATPSSSTAIDLLSIAAMAYLLLPTFFFFGGWMKFWPAAVSIALLLACLGYSIPWGRIRWRQRPPASFVALVVVVAIAWAMFGGAGHFFYANKDWLIRDAVYGDLIQQSWPVSYGTTDEGLHLLLRSAIGFFLPAAALSSLAGLQFANLFLFGWTVIGVTLFLLLLPLRWEVGARTLALLCVAALFSGMDVLGTWLTSGLWPVFPVSIEWWVPLTYTSLTGQLYWAPNHAIPLWLAAAMFFRHWRHEDFPRIALPLLLATLIWTPFAILGMAPLMILLLAARLRAGSVAVAGSLRKGVLALLVAYPILRYLTLDLGGLMPSGAVAIAAQPVSAALPIGDFLLHTYAPFVLMEFGILAMLLHGCLQGSRVLYWTALLTLASLPFLRFGPSNDALLRISTPSLVVLMLLVLVVLQQPWTAWRDRRLALLLVLAIGAVTPFHEIWRGATGRHVPPDFSFSLRERAADTLPAHYVGKLDAPELMWLFKRPREGRERQSRAQRRPD
jgi:hypothetical protein